MIVINELDNELRIYTPDGVYTFDYITEKLLSLFDLWYRGYSLEYEPLRWKFLDLYVEVEEEDIEKIFEALQIGEKFPICELFDWEGIKKETEDHDYSHYPYALFYTSEILLQNF